MVQKIPPPPQFTGPEWQSFNRWLLEVTSVLSNTGGINPDQVDGLTALFSQVDVNTSDIINLQGTTGGQAANIANLQIHDGVIDAEIVTINGQITTLSARAQVLNGVGVPAGGLGVIGDWYGNTDPTVGTKAVYVKTAAATWTRITAFL
jgi:hypothetical protein